MRLLVVDFDFFFPTPQETDRDGKWILWDWDHNESLGQDIQAMLWAVRASAFMRKGIALPGVSDEIGTFWSRFQVQPDAGLYYADSNVKAFDRAVATPEISEVWLYDAHHDAGYKGKTIEDVVKRQRVDCGDWMIGYHLVNGIPPRLLHVRYPRWRTRAFKERRPFIRLDRRFDNGKPLAKPFDRVFVCRSGTWVPSWVEDAFWSFLEAAPNFSMATPLGDIQRREFKPADVEELNRVMESELLQKAGIGG